MNAVYTECSIGLSGSDPVVGEHRAIIRVHDQGAGPFLGIRGVNAEPCAGETRHEFFLCTAAEVDKFAKICKAMLKQADPVPVAVISGQSGGVDKLEVGL